jgi:hypothetical protein
MDQFIRKASLVGSVTLAMAVIAGCGGGGGGSSGSSAPAPAPVAQKGTLNVAITDGPGDTYNHVWVTISAISLHTSPDEIWNPDDATWQTTQLPAPVTVDLASLNNGTLANLFQNIVLPVGTYRQIRLFFVGANQDLSSSAQSIKDNETPPAPLQWNDQVEYQDSSGTLHEAPLEIAYPTQGVQLLGSFAVTQDSTLNLAVDFDLEKIIVPFEHDGGEAFTMRPNLAYFDLNQSGAITGQVDPTRICQPSVLPSSTCAYNLIVHAELLSADGSRHWAARSTSVDPVTGQFVLYPVDLKDPNGNPLSYDLVVRGRNMETLLVTGIAPAGTPTSSPTVVQTAPLEPTISATEYTAQLASPLQPLTSGFSLYQETLPVSSQVAHPVPYEIRWGNTDPFSGILFQPMPLENANILLAPYNGGDTLSFTSVIPQEGLGGYNVADNENAYYTLSNNLLVQAPTSGSSTTFTPPIPTLDAGIQRGSVSGNIAVANAAQYDHGTLVLSRFATIVTAVDISADLASGGAFSIGNLPAGDPTTPVPGAYYYGYLRLWKAGTGLPAKIVTIPGFVDLRKTASVTGFNVTVSAN